VDKKTPTRLKKSIVVLCLTIIAIYAFLIRCLHLLHPDYYYIISADSYFFHWMAELVQSGQTVDHTFLGHTVPTIWHTGITYPLAYTAKAMSFVFGMSPTDAMTFVSKFLPPTLAVISIVVIYLAVSKIYDQRVGLFSAFAWAILLQTIFMQGAGYLDRDGLSVLLMMMGAFIFYLSRGWHWKIGHLDLGWVAGGLSVVAIEALLIWEWEWIGPVLLLAILTAFFIVEVLGRSYRHIAASSTKTKDLSTRARQWLVSIVTAIRESNWRPFALIIGLSVLFAGISPGFPYMYRLATWTAREALFPTSGGVPVQEMQGLNFFDLLTYGFMTIPLVLGLGIMLTKHRRVDLFCLSWFACLLLLGIFARRVFLYAAPAGCIISGLGLAFIWDLGKSRLLRRYIETSVLRYARIGAAMFLLLLLFVSSLLSYTYVSQSRVVAPDNNWQDALAYLRTETPNEAVVMSWWDYGYWILDLAERRPVIDGGFYAYDQERLEDVGLAYCTKDASEAAQVMQKYGADYLVFSKTEIKILPIITKFGLGETYGDGHSIPPELEGSLYDRALSGDFQSESGLKRVYPGPEVENPEVVILGLE
jgi:asparagine N-glycosylation enzyme membrane subunit Stt3